MKPELEGMTRIAPGVYDDGEGGMHLDVDELLEANGFEANAENRARLEAEVQAIASAYGIPTDEA
jgi:hypothetical protein